MALQTLNSRFIYTTPKYSVLRILCDKIRTFITTLIFTTQIKILFFKCNILTVNSYYVMICDDYLISIIIFFCNIFRLLFFLLLIINLMNFPNKSRSLSFLSVTIQQKKVHVFTDVKSLTFHNYFKVQTSKSWIDTNKLA